MRKTVEGSNDKNEVVLYTLTTCIWCKRTKQLLSELNIKYDYIDVDLLTGEERQNAMKEIETFNPQGGFPTIVINKTKTVIGYKPEEIKEILL